LIKKKESILVEPASELSKIRTASQPNLEPKKSKIKSVKKIPPTALETIRAE
jgi:hypothetical protein